MPGRYIPVMSLVRRKELDPSDGDDEDMLLILVVAAMIAAGVYWYRKRGVQEAPKASRA